MSEVKRKRNESFEAFIRRVKQQWQRSGRILEVRKGQHFASKPSKNRRRNSAVVRLRTKSRLTYLKKAGRLSAKETLQMNRRAK